MYEEIIEKTKKLVAKETSQSVMPLFDLANEVGQILAQKLNANKDIILLGTLLMDLKHKQAREEDRISEHVQMSLNASKKFLEQFDLDEETKKKIYNCIEAHHKDVPFMCIEAEICANADCYKFLHPKGVLLYVSILSLRGGSFEESLYNVEEKMDEKWNILSLDICKQELETYYNTFKIYIDKARKM